MAMVECDKIFNINHVNIFPYFPSYVYVMCIKFNGETYTQRSLYLYLYLHFFLYFFVLLLSFNINKNIHTKIKEMIFSEGTQKHRMKKIHKVFMRKC